MWRRKAARLARMLVVGVILAGVPIVMGATQDSADDLFRTMPWTLAFSPDGEYLACGGRDGTISLWKINDSGFATAFGRLSEHDVWISATAFASDRGRMATGDNRGRIIVWDLDRQWILRSFRAGQVRSLAFSVDSETLIGGTSTGIWAWRLSDGHRLATLCDYTFCWGEGIGRDAFSLSPLPDSRGVLATFVGGQSLSLFVFSASSRHAVMTNIEWDHEESWFLGETDMWWSMALSPTDPLIAVGGFSGDIAIWRFSENGLGERVDLLVGHESRVDSLVFSPSGKFLLTGAWDQTVRLWNLDEGRLLATYREDGSLPYCTAAFSPCGRYVAASTAAGRILIIRIEDGTVISSVRHADDLPVLTFEQADPQVAAEHYSDAVDDIAWGLISERTVQSLEEAGAIYSRIGDAATEADCLRDLGYCLYELAEYEDATYAYGEALILYSDLANEENARRCESQIIACSYRISNSDDRIGALEGALERFRLTGRLSASAKVLDLLGLYHDANGAYENAVSCFREAAEIYGKLGDLQKQTQSLVSACKSIADLAERISCLDDLLATARGKSDQAGEAEALMALGLAYAAAGRHSEASVTYLQASGIYFALAEYRSVAFALTFAGKALMVSESYDDAVGYFELAADIYLSFDDKTLTLEFEAWNVMDLADCLRQQGRYSEAIVQYDYALSLAVLGTGIINLTVRPLWNIGRCHWSMEDLTSAQAYYLRAIREAEAYAGTWESESRRQWFYSGSLTNLYAEYIELLVECGQIGDCLKVAERFRAKTFVDLLAEGPIDTLEDIAEEGIRTGVVEASVIKADLAEVVASLPADAAALEYFVAEETTYLWLIRDGSAGDPIRIEIERSDLREQVLAFRIAIETSSTGLMNAPDEAISALSRDLYELLIAPVEDRLEGIEHLVIVPSGPLYYLPFCALLDCPGCEGPDFFGGEYLIERYTLSYTPSLTTLKYVWASSEIAQADPLFLAVADPDSGDAEVLRLPEAQDEADAVAKLFDPSEVYVGTGATEDVIIARASSTDHLLLSTHGVFNPLNPMFSYLLLSPTDESDGRLYTYEVFSLDLHAALVTLSACETLLPALEDAEAEARAVRGAWDDGDDLLTEEQLEVLTAGDEIVGLTRAFLYAGTPSVLSSLWRVVSETTAPLMVAFYGYLQQGLDKAEALRQAQLDVMATYPHPRYWAAFELVGDWKSCR